MVEHRLIDKRDANSLEQQLLASGLSVSQLVKTAWAAAASYRDTDMRGGVNGARLRLATTAPNTACSPIVPEHSATTSSPL
jgi:catalase-peroxidase